MITEFTTADKVFLFDYLQQTFEHSASRAIRPTNVIRDHKGIRFLMDRQRKVTRVRAYLGQIPEQLPELKGMEYVYEGGLDKQPNKLRIKGREEEELDKFKFLRVVVEKEGAISMTSEVVAIPDKAVSAADRLTDS